MTKVQTMMAVLGGAFLIHCGEATLSDGPHVPGNPAKADDWGGAGCCAAEVFDRLTGGTIETGLTIQTFSSPIIHVSGYRDVVLYLERAQSCEVVIKFRPDSQSSFGDFGATHPNPGSSVLDESGFAPWSSRRYRVHGADFKFEARCAIANAALDWSVAGVP